mmetsp:Transcript_19260/g.43370  ORF Transcript_19260/g.43370 Transcript_19260/m.43370 type:complete len:209 (-) Transcript_19260:6-632(-)
MGSGPDSCRGVPPPVLLPDHPQGPEASEPAPDRGSETQGIGLRAVQDAEEGAAGPRLVSDDRQHRHSQVHGARGGALRSQLQREGGHLLDGDEFLVHLQGPAALRFHRPPPYRDTRIDARAPPRRAGDRVGASRRPRRTDVVARPRTPPVVPRDPAEADRDEPESDSHPERQHQVQYDMSVCHHVRSLSGMDEIQTSGFVWDTGVLRS